MAKWRPTYRRVFVRCRADAERRGIPWRLTLDEFVGLWGMDWDRRAVEKLDLCRTGDEGDYALGNVRIDTRANNIAEMSRVAEQLRQPVGPTLAATKAAHAKERLIDAVAGTNGNQSAAAARLGMSFRSFRYLRDKYGLDFSHHSSILRQWAG